MAKRAFIRVVAAILLLGVIALPEPRLLKPGLVSTSVEGERPEKQAKRKFDESVDGYPVLWQEPLDLESRDLFYGIGGQKGAPDPSEKYIFLKRDTDGTS